MEFLTAYIIGVFSSLTVLLLLKYKGLLKFLPNTTEKGYLIELEKKIRDMPFIYKDLEVDVINDFVDVEFQSINLETLRLREVRNAITITEDERLRRTSTMLFLGNAGIGKTTYQRRTILNLINNRDDARYLYQMERPLPLYLPLKAIDNSSPFPVFRYIRDNNPLFSHKFGVRKLNKLVKNRRLFLFLDGYDEIPFTGGSHNFVQEELGMMFSSNLSGSSLPELPNNELTEFYRGIASCRVWLTSRREFFERNPIAKLGLGTIGVAAVEIRGIGNNRIKLAQKIFDKYRLRSKEFYEFLNEEFFLYEIDNSGDDELKKLSDNPLFLTVMCYIYAQKALEQKTHKVSWTSGFEDLIIECMDLLLHDLDEIKARDLPRAHREALLTRRNPYFEEKKVFLQYFALQLFFDDKSVFSLTYLKSKLREFFENEYHNLSNEIVQTLFEDNPSQPNIALQLLYQGVFVLVDKSPTQISYDFPHRRFREVLASRYIATPERYEQLLANIDKEQFSEFLQVFFNSKGFKSQSFQASSLTHILEKAKWHSESAYYEQVTSHFMDRKPAEYDHSDAVHRFLADCLSNSVPFRISKSVLREFKAPQNFLSSLPSHFRAALIAKDSHLLSLSCALMEFFNRSLLVELLKISVSSQVSSNAVVLPTIIQYMLRNSPELILDEVNLFRDSTELFAILCYSLCSYLSGKDELTEDDLEFIAECQQGSDRTRQLLFFYFIHEHSPTHYGRLQKFFDFDIDSELYDYALIANKNKEPQPAVSGDSIRYNLITKKSIRQVASAADRRTIGIILYKDIQARNSSGALIKDRLYAVISPSHRFKESVLRGLQSIADKLYLAPEFNKRARNLVTKATDEMVKGEFRFMTSNELPSEVRASEVRESKRYTVDGFANEMTNIVLRNSLVDGHKVFEVRELVDNITYHPVRLFDMFT